MFEALASVQIRALAEKALAVREAGEEKLRGVRDAAFGEPRPARRQPEPGADVAVDALSEGEPHRRAFVEALSSLPLPARRELWALVLIGRGDYGLDEWDQAVMEAGRLSDFDARVFLEQPDLHDHLMKAVYEIEHRLGAAS